VPQGTGQIDSKDLPALLRSFGLNMSQASAQRTHTPRTTIQRAGAVSQASELRKAEREVDPAGTGRVTLPNLLAFFAQRVGARAPGLSAWPSPAPRLVRA
jgi:Ca2+-binding EF-hand superfamily protein